MGMVSRYYQDLVFLAFLWGQQYQRSKQNEFLESIWELFHPGIQGLFPGSPVPLHLRSATGWHEHLKIWKGCREGLRRLYCHCCQRTCLGFLQEVFTHPCLDSPPWSHPGILTPDLTDQKNYLEPGAYSSPSPRVCEALYSG